MLFYPPRSDALFSNYFEEDLFVFADATVKARIQIGWTKFRQLLSLLTNKDISLIMRGRLTKVV